MNFIESQKVLTGNIAKVLKRRAYSLTPFSPKGQARFAMAWKGEELEGGHFLREDLVG